MFWWFLKCRLKPSFFYLKPIAYRWKLGYIIFVQRAERVSSAAAVDQICWIKPCCVQQYTQAYKQQNYS